MLRKAIIGAFALGLLASAGCVMHIDGDGDYEREDWRERQERNRRIISTLELGASRAAVRERLGEPDFSEAYRHDGAEYRVLHYRTQHRNSDGETTFDETTPVIFRDGKLEGWGATLYDKISRGGAP